MNKQDYDRPINVLDEVRVKPLLEQINKKGIEFKYFVSLDYPRRTSNYNKVISDNKFLKKELQEFFGSDVRCLFFIEKHTGANGAPHSGCYHRHILTEEPSLNTRQVHSYLLNRDPDGLFQLRMEGTLSDESKLKMMENAFRSSKTTCNSRKGTHVHRIQSNLNRVLAYASKQYERFHPSYEVLDPSSSDIDCSFLLQYKQDGLEYKTRPIHLPKGTAGTLQFAYR